MMDSIRYWVKEVIARDDFGLQRKPHRAYRTTADMQYLFPWALKSTKVLNLVAPKPDDLWNTATRSRVADAIWKPTPPCGKSGWSQIGHSTRSSLRKRDIQYPNQLFRESCAFINKRLLLNLLIRTMWILSELPSWQCDPVFSISTQVFKIDIVAQAARLG